MDAKHLSHETIREHVGRINTDVVSGWEKGVGPRRKVGGRLYEHWPPEHLPDGRRADWMEGYRAGKAYRDRWMRKSVMFHGYRADGSSLTVTRRGWGAKRGQVLAQMEKMGIASDVTASYFEGGELKRTVRCGI